MAISWPIIVARIERSSMLRATRWRNLIEAKSLSFAR